MSDDELRGQTDAFHATDRRARGDAARDWRRRVRNGSGAGRADAQNQLRLEVQRSRRRSCARLRPRRCRRSCRALSRRCARPLSVRPVCATSTCSSSAGMVLHQGKIAEMKTGEGKTLVATLPLYLNALTGRGAHLVTPNDYLSKWGVQMDGADLPSARRQCRRDPVGRGQPELGSFVFDPEYPAADDRYRNLLARRRKARRICRRYLRHQQRVRVRLSRATTCVRTSTTAPSARSCTRSLMKWTTSSSTRPVRR